MRTHVARHTGRLISKISRTLKIGGGSAAPGLYALKVDPNLVENLVKQIPQNIVVTGTNGKTTTARMISHFLGEKGYRVIRNSTGSNLERGIASALIHGGNLKKYDVGVWELDEAAFNKTIFKIKPQLIIFLNVFRDQLDRYGEVDTVIKKWQETLKKIDWETTILINGSDLNLLNMQEEKNSNPNLNFQQFQVKNHQLKYEQNKTAQKNGVKSRFQAEVIKDNGLAGSDVKLNFPSGSLKFNLPIPGLYHVYDLLAAFSAVYLLNIDLKNIEKSLYNFSPAFGRVEKLVYQNKELFIFLIKNPAGATAVFESITKELREDDRILAALNDNFADGTDVSWIWDADFEKLQAKEKKSLKIICSGTRAADLAIRLKYAGFDPNLIVVESDPKIALQQALDGLNGRLFILPTYTALLKLQEILAQMGIKQRYWQEH